MKVALKMAHLILLFAIIPIRVLKGETNYFLVGRVPPVKADSYVLPLSKQEDIDYARYIISLGESIRTNESAKPLVFAYVAAGKDGINRNYVDPKFREWSWHVRQFIAFAQLGAEIYDGSPTGLEHCPEWYRGEINGGEIGFWLYTVVKDLGPAPLALSITPDGQNLEFYWSAPGTNFVFTLENNQSPSSTGWIAVPGASWPLPTNHWTIPKTDVTGSFFRVRAQPAGT